MDRVGRFDDAPPCSATRYTLKWRGAASGGSERRPQLGGSRDQHGRFVDLSHGLDGQTLSGWTLRPSPCSRKRQGRRILPPGLRAGLAFRLVRVFLQPSRAGGPRAKMRRRGARRGSFAVFRSFRPEFGEEQPPASSWRTPPVSARAFGKDGSHGNGNWRNSSVARQARHLEASASRQGHATSAPPAVLLVTPPAPPTVSGLQMPARRATPCRQQHRSEPPPCRLDSRRCGFGCPLHCILAETVARALLCGAPVRSHPPARCFSWFAPAMPCCSR
jgi:hypothetical protein